MQPSGGGLERQETSTTPHNDRITLGDVLQALFSPSAEGEADTLSLKPAAIEQLLKRSSSPASPPPEAAQIPDTPAEIHYPPPVIVSEPGSVSVGRRLQFVLGALAALSFVIGGQLISVRSMLGLAAYLAAAITWIVVLLITVNTDSPETLKRGPWITGGGALRLPEAVQPGVAAAARAIMAAIALIFSVLVFFWTAGNMFDLRSAAAWLISIVLWMLVASEKSLTQLWAGWSAWAAGLPGWWPSLERSQVITLAAVVIITAVGAYLRFHRMGDVPPEMTSDHVEMTLDVYRIAAYGQSHVFFTNNGGREALQFYLLLLIKDIFGTGWGFATQKILTAIQGVLLLPLIVLLAREFIDRETGLFAAALLAVSWWHILLSNLGERIVLTPLVFTLVLICLIRGIRTGGRRPWLWAGFWMGVGVYSYQAMRIVPLVAVAAFVIAVASALIKAVRSGQPALQEAAFNAIYRQGLNLVLAGVIAFAFFVPMARVWVDFPDQLWNRVLNRTTNNEVPIQGSPAAIFIDNYWDAMLMYNVEGDTSWWHSLPRAPMLDIVAGGLLFLGVIAWSMRLVMRRDPADLFLIVAVAVMLLPSALAVAFPIENPSATRASGTMPLIMILAAWPLALVRQQTARLFGQAQGTVLGLSIAAVLLVPMFYFNYQNVFVRYPASYRAASPYPGAIADAVEEAKGQRTSEGVWILSWPHWQDHRSIGVELGDPEFDQNITSADLNTILTNFPYQFEVRPLVFVFHQEDSTALTILEAYFPEGQPELIRTEAPGKAFFLYVVE